MTGRVAITVRGKRRSLHNRLFTKRQISLLAFSAVLAACGRDNFSNAD